MKHLALLLLLTGCSTVTQIPDSSHVYRRELSVTVNGVTCIGACVAKQSQSYKLHVEADRIDYLSFESCHRKLSLEDLGDKWDYTYVPQALEKECPIEIVVLDKKNAKNGFALIVFESPTYVKQAQLMCNGVVYTAHGVSICQSKVGLLQTISFDEDMIAHPDDGCPLSETKDKKSYTFKLVHGFCGYVFGSKNGFHQMVTIGTEDKVLQEL